MAETTVDPEIVEGLPKLMGATAERRSYIDFCIERGDMVVRAANVTNPEQYRPIRWAIKGRETEDKRGRETLPTATVAAKRKLNPLLDASPSEAAKGTIEQNDDEAVSKPDNGQAEERAEGKTRKAERRGMNKVEDRKANVDYIKQLRNLVLCRSEFGNSSSDRVCPREHCRLGHDLAEQLNRTEFVQLPGRLPKEMLEGGVQGQVSTAELDSIRYPSSRLLPIVEVSPDPVKFQSEDSWYCSFADCHFGPNCVAYDPNDKMVSAGHRLPSAVVGSRARLEGIANNDLESNPRGSRALGEFITEANGFAKTLGALGMVFESSEELKAQKKQKASELFGGSNLFLAPLTTVGNMPFRRLVTKLGCDVTVSEMAVANSILRGQRSEHELILRHPEEKKFGIQLAGGDPRDMIGTAELLTNSNCSFDFIDINMGCPLDQLHRRFGGGSILMSKQKQAKQIVQGMSSILQVPLSVKFRSSHFNKVGRDAHILAPRLVEWGADAVIHHGRTAKMRYTGSANWEYIQEVARSIPGTPLIGNGDVFSPYDMDLVYRADSELSRSVMIGRGALIKPWIFSEIKEKKLWDVSSSFRFGLLQDFAKFGLDRWGSDLLGVETTRKHLLEQLSFLCRYVPVGLLERLPQAMQSRPPQLQGRDELETLMASTKSEDWVKISEMIIGRRPKDFVFVPKHKSNAY